jgi:hypothetical protein
MYLGRRPRRSNFDDSIFEAAAAGMQRVLDAGGSRELAEQALSDALQSALTSTAPRVVDHLEPSLVLWLCY